MACAPVQNRAVPATRAIGLAQDLPPMKAFATVNAPQAARANTEIAQDFMDLSFRMESGREIPFMTRFEGPITVRFSNPPSESLRRDLDGLLTRLRGEAGIDILFTNSETANITIETVPSRKLQRAVPNAACFVVPRVSSWKEFQRARNSDQIDWTQLTTRENAAIFLPEGAAPQELRDCLHEELAQALGPLNDLYRLPDSVFNDDNIHTVLTGFDMLILRAYYAPELSNGMRSADVAQRLPAVLQRLNPAGRLQQDAPVYQTTSDWSSAMQTALTRGTSVRQRQNAAQTAIRLGSEQGWLGPRQGFAHYAHGRLQLGSDPQKALQSFVTADALYQREPEMQIHSAHVAVQKAAFTMARGDAEATLSLVDAAIPVAYSHQNAALLSTLMMFKAEALDMKGNENAATTVRLDSLGWARYGFGSDRNVQARLAEIAALRPF